MTGILPALVLIAVVVVTGVLVAVFDATPDTRGSKWSIGALLRGAATPAGGQR